MQRSLFDELELGRLERLVVVLVVAGIFARAQYDAAVASAQLAHWAVGDWLINYGGGFVRRGLPGQIALLAGDFVSIRPEWLVYLIKTACYLAMFTATAWIALRARRLTLAHALTLLSPAVLLFIISDPGLAGRKEILLIAWIAVLAQQRSSRTVDWSPSYLHLSVGWFLLVAAHEGLLFFWPVFMGSLYLMNSRNSYRWFPLVVSAVPALMLFLAGFPALSPADLPAICGVLGDSAPQGCGQHLFGAVGWLNATFNDGLFRVRDAFQLRSLATVSVALILSLGWSLRSAHNDGVFAGMSARKRRELAYLALFGCVSVSVLAAMSVDWGRWIHIVAALLAFSVVAEGSSRPGRQGTESERVTPSNDGSQFRKSIVRYWAVFAVSLAYLTSWSLPYCCVRGASISWLTDGVQYILGLIRWG